MWQISVPSLTKIPPQSTEIVSSHVKQVLPDNRHRMDIVQPDGQPNNMMPKMSKGGHK